MGEERPVVALDFLGLERSAPETQTQERNGDKDMIQKPTASFPSFDNRTFPSVAMSLRTRESSSMALKRIFDQINASSENGLLQPLDTSATGKRWAPFSERKDGDGKHGGEGLAEQADRALESTFRKPLEELRETDFAQRTKDIRRAWNQSQDGGNLLSLRSPADGEGRRAECNARSSPQLAADVKQLSAFSSLHQQDPLFDKNSMFGFQNTERKASPSPAQRHGGNPSSLFNGPEHQLHQFAAHQQAFDQSRKRVTDLDLSFRKAQVQDPAAFLSQQTAFGSPISVPAFRTSYPDTLPRAAQWPMQGVYPVQGIHAQSSGASRPTVLGAQPTAQLTIFYSGTVNVYDDVPADKAHAIMLLAGTGNSWSSHLTTNAQPTFENVLPVPRETPLPPEAVKPAATSIALSGSATTATTKIACTPLTPSTASSPPIISPAVQTPTTSVVSAEMKQSSSMTPDVLKQAQPQQPAAASAAKRSHAELPHARKASLARFLEKRKDRVQSKPPVNETKASEDRDVTSSERPSSPKRLCTRSPSPSAATRPRCSSPFRSQIVADDQITENNRPPTPQRVV